MKLLTLFLFSLITMSAAVAHGPDGDHAHGDAPAAATSSGLPPRIDAATEAFELVGQLQGNELALLVDRFDTNKPVLNGRLEVEFNGMKAPAAFRADQGDYAVTDAAFVQALAKPGQHALVFTLTADNDSDLLEGTLAVASASNGHAPVPFPWRWVALAGIAAVVLLTLAALRRRSPKSTGK
ncbi:MAG TPA: hypothetical protein VGE12_05190 [Noviherbaspirillum sp.]